MLMDRLDRRGGLFLEWASAVFGDGERRGSDELPKDNSTSAGKSTSSGATTFLPGEVPATAQPDWLPTGFALIFFLQPVCLLA